MRALEAEKAVLVEKMEEIVYVNIPDHLLFVSGSDSQTLDTRPGTSAKAFA